MTQQYEMWSEEADPLLREDEPLPDVGDPKQVRAKQKKAKREQQSKDDALAAIMSQPQTRAWMWDLLLKCMVFATSYSQIAHEMAFNEGKRAVGLELLAAINRVAPDQYAVMARENPPVK